MTDQRMWVRTLDGDVVDCDQIVRYKACKATTGPATGRTAIEAFTNDGLSAVRLGPFVSKSQALDFARRHFGPVIDPADLHVVEQSPPAAADLGKYDPPGAVDLLQALEDSFAKARETFNQTRRMD